MTRYDKVLRFVTYIVRIIWLDTDPFVRLYFFFAFALVLVSSILVACAPVALKIIIDGLPPAPRATMPLLLIGFYVFSQWADKAMIGLRSFVYERAAQRLFRTLSGRLFTHVLNLPLRFHLERPAGSITLAVDNGLRGLHLVLDHTFFAIVPMTAELITATVILWHLHQPVLLLLFGAAIVAYGIVFAPSVIRMTERASAASLAAMDSSALMTDSILNYEVLKYFTAESMMHDRFGEALSHTESEWMRFFRYQAISGVLTSTVYAAFVAVTIVYATHLVNRFALSVGDWVLVIALISQIMRPVEVLSLAIRQLAQGIAFTETMMELITAEPEQQQSEAVFPHGCAGRLEFQHVRLAFSTRQLVLRDVSFNIPAGSTLAVVGDSGAGKSTLVKLLVRLIEPTGGQILLDGVPLSNISLPQLRQAVAIVPQEIMLLDTTIAENIALGRPGCSQRDVEDAAKVAALHDEIVRFPSGYHTRIGQRGIKLSGGEKQRIAIARAALKRPRIYVFDEATSSLDSKTEQVIVRNLRAVSQFTTTIIIAHRLSTVVGADEIIFLSAGSVVERGTHISLLRKNGQYSRFWHAQQRSV